VAESLSRPDAFSVLFDRHFLAIHRYLERRVGQAPADDLASLTFTVAFERRGTFWADAESARPWLYGIATRLLSNHRRAEQRLLDTIARLRIAGPTDDADIADGGVARADASMEGQRVAAALSRLEVDQRDVLLLYAWGELSYEEIAAALAIPVGTVRSRMSRARRQVTSDLEAPDPGTSAVQREAR
jgi:RNA polymerase sigma-70 factor (ECF subfamily)